MIVPRQTAPRDVWDLFLPALLGPPRRPAPARASDVPHDSELALARAQEKRARRRERNLRTRAGR